MEYVKTLRRVEMNNIMAGVIKSENCYQGCDNATSDCLQNCIDSHPNRGPGSGYAQCVDACEAQTDKCFEKC